MPAKYPIRLAVLALLVSLFSPGLPAQRRVPYETILDYHSDITLQDDASLLVMETITVYSMGQQIRHGIYRDFPTDYKDSYGNHYVVGFEMLWAARDSYREPFRVEDIANGKRIYLGDAKTLISPGEHTYQIVYSTNRQLGFFRITTNCSGTLPAWVGAFPSNTLPPPCISRLIFLPSRCIFPATPA